MSISTRPIFYYGYTINVNNIYLNFDEGGSELTALITAGSYSFEDLADEIALRMNEVGGQTYTVTADRDNRSYTISADASFSLLFSTGSNAGGSVASVIGFESTDYTGATSYEGGAAGSVYEPRFPLQDYVALEDWQEYSEASINESASGKVEVYSIGSRRFTEFNISYVTDNTMRDGSLFVNDSNAVDSLRSFMVYAITKGPIEFMVDKEDRSTYSTLILESTPTSSTGTGFKLRELYGQRLVGFFETGRLKFRERN